MPVSTLVETTGSASCALVTLELTPVSKTMPTAPEKTIRRTWFFSVLPWLMWCRVMSMLRLESRIGRRPALDTLHGRDLASISRRFQTDFSPGMTRLGATSGDLSRRNNAAVAATTVAVAENPLSTRTSSSAHGESDSWSHPSDSLPSGR